MYAGPEIELYYRYSGLLYLVYNSLINGIAMPLLFPIALIGLVILYVSEKIMFVRYYQKPPIFDEKLNS